MHALSTPVGRTTLTLRPEVSLRRDEDGVHIWFAHWEVGLSSQALDDAPEIADLLANRCIRDTDLSSSGAAVIALLDAQGCFLPIVDREVSVRDILALFQPLRSKFYADYYAHPLWCRLRTGQASMGELLAWVVHNYHISRSAGVIAARMATHTSSVRLRSFFREDALEEFWHCDSFYFVNNPNLTLNADKVKAYVPLPASTAFEDMALRAADENWLGHLLIAYFQESSIIFREDSERFYDCVEENYQLRGFFAGWRRHMTLDLDHGHANGLIGLFDPEQHVSVKDLATSMRCVQLAHFFLLRALDQIGAHARLASDALDLRQPTSLAVQAPGSGLFKGGDETCRSGWGAFLIGALREAAFRSLAFARAHNDIIAAGRLSAVLEQGRGLHTDTGLDVANPWLAAVRNFLIERSTNVRLLIELAREMLDGTDSFDPLLNEMIVAIRAERDRLAALVGPTNSGVEVAQFRELIALARSGETLAPLTLSAPASASTQA